MKLSDKNTRNLVGACIAGLLLGGLFLLSGWNRPGVYVTDISLGNHDDMAASTLPPLPSGRGPTTILAMLQDTILVGDNFQDIGFPNARSRVLVSLVSVNQAIRLRTEAYEDEAERIQVLHKAIADRTLAILLPRATSLRKLTEFRLEADRKRFAVAEEDRKLQSRIIDETKAAEQRAEALFRPTSEGTIQGSPGAGAPGAGRQASDPLQLWAAYQRLILFELPALRMQAEHRLFELDGLASELQAKIETSKTTLALFEGPAIKRLAERESPANSPGRVMRFILGFLVGIILYGSFVILWSRVRPA